jgi:DNA-binding IclR family transcriptional regulator
MSIAAIRRSFLVIHHLKTQGETRFTDLVHMLCPISRTALSHLLSSLEEIGELERDGRLYRLAPKAAALAGSDRTIYGLPPALLAQTHPLLTRLSQQLNHSCALYARVGNSTMKIMDRHNRGEGQPAFAAVGSEWPLVPMHGFARLFLAHAPESVARECYRNWLPYLQPNPQVRVPASDQAFCAELAKVRHLGYALEYKEEIQPIMRVALPVMLPDCREVRFAIGLVANFVYLLDVESYVSSLSKVADELAQVLAGKVPRAILDREAEDAPLHPPAPAALPTAEISEFPEGARLRRSATRNSSPGKALAVG